MPRIARQQCLDIVRHYAYQTIDRFGQCITNRRVASIALATKVAADKRMMKENLRFGDTHRRGQRLARVVGHLATEPYVHAPVTIINMDQHRLRLQRDLVLPLRHIRLLDDDIRRGKSRFEIAFFMFNEDMTHITLRRGLKDDLWDVVMVGFNILNQTAREAVLKKAMQNYVGVQVIFTLRKALSHPKDPNDFVTRLIRKSEVDPADIDHMVHRVDVQVQ